MDTEDETYPVQKIHGQLVYGPHPRYRHLVPPRGSEVFVAKLPRNVFEDVLAPLLSRAGIIFELRIMIDFSGSTRGFAFVTYLDVSTADRAIDMLNGFEIRPKRKIFLSRSLDNCRISLTGIPRELSAEKIYRLMRKNTDTVKEVIAFLEPGCPSRNRGRVIVEYESHRAACIARREFISNPDLPFRSNVKVDWASADRSKDPEGPKQHWSETPPLQKYFESIKNVDAVLFIENLPEVVNIKFLKDFLLMEKLGIKEVVKVNGCAFLHFRTKIHAEHALESMKGLKLAGREIHVVLARNVHLSSSSKDSSVPIERPPEAASMPLNVESNKSHENLGNLLPSPTAESSYDPFASYLSPEQMLLYICKKQKWRYPNVTFTDVSEKNGITGNMVLICCKIELFSHVVIEHGRSMPEASNKASKHMLQMLQAVENVEAVATGPCQYSASNYIVTGQSDLPARDSPSCSTYAEATAVGTKVQKFENKNASSVRQHSDADMDILRNHYYDDKWPPLLDRSPHFSPKDTSSNLGSWSSAFDYDKSFTSRFKNIRNEYLVNTASGNQFDGPTSGNHSHDGIALNGRSPNHCALKRSLESGFDPSSSNVATTAAVLYSLLSDLSVRSPKASSNICNAQAKMEPATVDRDHIPLYRRHAVNYRQGDSTLNRKFPHYSALRSSGSSASTSDAGKLISNSHVRAGIDSAVSDDTYSLTYSSDAVNYPRRDSTLNGNFPHHSSFTLRSSGSSASNSCAGRLISNSHACAGMDSAVSDDTYSRDDGDGPNSTQHSFGYNFSTAKKF